MALKRSQLNILIFGQDCSEFHTIKRGTNEFNAGTRLTKLEREGQYGTREHIGAYWSARGCKGKQDGCKGAQGRQKGHKEIQGEKELCSHLA